MFTARVTSVADLEARLLPNKAHLAREDKPALLEPFFADPTVGDAENWKTQFLNFKDSVSAEGCIAKVTEIMHKSLVGSLTERETLTIGWRVLESTSWAWRNVDGRSRKREWESLARAAIVEHGEMREFRKPLVKDTPVAHLRKGIMDILADASIPTTEGGKQIYKWTFSDGYSPSKHSVIPDLEDITVDERLQAVTANIRANEFRAQILKIIHTVERSEVATIDGTPRGALEENVHVALTALVEVWLFDLELYFVVHSPARRFLSMGFA